MKLQLIMLPQPILVSDEEIKDGDSLYYATTNVILKNYVSETPRRKDDYKIIAGIPELPSIDFSALSEEDCKKIGWVDIEKLADKYSNFERASKWGDIEEKASEAVQKAFGIKYRKDFLKLKNAKKVNLFLCSRDIKHGDKYHDYAGSPVFTHDEDDPMLDKDCFKIIGEISPNATWVKEGDEFDEEDIFMTYVDDAGTVWKNTEVGALTGYTGEFTPRCMLKCSTCKTFH